MVLLKYFFSIEVLFLLFSKHALAAMGETFTSSASAQVLLSKIPVDFRGALFICDPFCDAVSVKREQKWQPSLEVLRITSTRFRLMPVSDPLFPVLFPLEEVDTKEASKIEKEAPTPPVATEIPEKSKDETPEPVKANDSTKDPTPPPTAFDNGFRVPLTLGYERMQLSSNSNIQSDLNFSGGSPIANVGLEYFRAKPLRLFKAWWQFELGYEMSILPAQHGLSSGGKLSLSQTKEHLYIWQKLRKWSWALRLASKKEQISVPMDMMSSYSMTENWLFAGLGLRYSRWEFFIDDGVNLSISETQSFRNSLSDFKALSAGVKYCWKQIKIWRWLHENDCLGVSYSQFSNSASVNPALDSSASAKFDRSELQLLWQINLGEDFLR